MSVNLSDIQANGIRLLNEKIKYLQEEITNTQADKDFVWSLWRQLQTTKPDLTNAISTALNREKEKTEIKDQKVLKILDFKDSKIENLLGVVSAKNVENAELKEKIAKLEGNLNEKNENINFLKLNIKTFEDKTIVFEQILRNQEEKNTQKLNDVEGERHKLMNKINALSDEIASKQQKEANMEKCIKSLDKRVHELEDDVTRAKRSNDLTLKDLSEYKAKNSKLNNEAERLLNEIKNKNEHIESLQVKLGDLLRQNTLHIEYTNQQEQIIQQLKLFQTELQKSFKTQEETSNSEINLLQQMYDETCKKFEENISIQNRLRLELEEKSTIIKNARKPTENPNKSSFLHQIISTANDVTLDDFKKLQNENDCLRKEIFEKNNLINELNLCRRHNPINRKIFSIQQKERSKSLETNRRTARRRTCSTESFEKKRIPAKKTSLSRIRDKSSKELSILIQENKHLLHEKLALEEQNDYNKTKLAKQNSTIKQLEFELDFKLENYKADYKEQLKECYAKIDMLTVNLNEQFSINERLKNEVSFKQDVHSKHEILIRDYQTVSYRLLQLQKKYKAICKRFRQFVKDATAAKNSNNTMESSLSTTVEYHHFLDVTDLDLENSITDDTISTTMSSPNDNDEALKFIKIKKITKNKSKKDSIDVNNSLKKKLIMLQKKLKKLLNIETEYNCMKKECASLKTEHDLLQDKLKQCKLNSENLTNEISSQKKKESEYKEKFENLKKIEKDNEDELKKHYETRIKSLTQDLSKQTNSNKTLKIDLDKATDKLKVAEEKLNHTERDIVQKRQLIEFYKKKLDEAKISTDKLQNTAEIDELQLKVQNLVDSNEKLKVQTKSLKTRIQVLQDEKTRSDKKYSDNEREIDDLKRELNLVRSQKKQFENELKESKAEVKTLNTTIKDIEYTVEKKLHSLTSSNLQTLDIAQEKLNDAYKRINNFEMILKTFYETIVNRSLRLKKRLNEKKDKQLPVASQNEHNSLKRAMNFASTVLNLSSADLEDIMSNNSAHDESKDEFDDNNKRLGKKWLTEFEALSKSQDSKMAVRLFELLDERLNELIQAEKQYLG